MTYLLRLLLLMLLSTVSSAYQGVPAEERGATRVPTSAQASKHLKHLEDLAETLANPGVRSYALVEVARLYSTSDKTLSLRLLDQAFGLARTLPAGTGKTFLEEVVCHQASVLAPDRLDDFLNQADPDARVTALHFILQRYESTNQLEKAVETIKRLTTEDEFPYGDADRIMAKLSGSSRTEKQALFGRALVSYKGHHHETIEPRDDFGLLLTHVWREIDSNSAEDGILYMLQEADAQKRSGRDSFRISITSATGSASFGSTYEYRLFQLLPVLSELDGAAAKDFLDKYSQTKQLLDRYPQGMLSFDDGNAATIIGVSNGGAMLQAPSPTWQQEVQIGRQIVALASSDPAQALGSTDSLNFPFIKANALEGIAKLEIRKNPDLAKIALEKVAQMSPKLIPVERAKYLLSSAELYLAMGDSKGAQAALETASDATGELYKEDFNKEDPNIALKAFWPSTIIWQRLVSVAGKIAPASASAIIKTITDQDIRMLAKLALESSKLNLPRIPIMTVSTHKAGEIRYEPEDQ